ncbi:sigma-E factor negative regulatory protein [Marinobacter salinexigens]|uniref:Sigma-E factor negative regulatory protein n=1 Tax=Marinobacter salinexigens TaxID=2919747 RepID=A0A5B0VB85_9GAMM|nr:sigma-E factor negative regulatory protein [Marinobacter salinexigens]KAA1172006.1 sigma-E factor negative regulatory protein [Marinobacter salinexigens]
MDDRLRETLSAMMDDEADELSVRRLLSHDSQAHVCDQWRRWQQVRDLMHHGHAPADAVDVSSAVREALDGRPRPSVTAGVKQDKTSRRWRWPAVAMVAVALVVGFGAGAGWESTGAVDGPVAAVGSPGPVTAAPKAEQEFAMQGLDEEQWEHMSRYLLEHAQHNSVGAGRGSVGYARMVSASGSGY